MVVHDLKTHPPFWEDVRNEEKSFEIRKDDRNFQKGDFIRLKEYHPKNGYTGRECFVVIIYKANGFGLIEGHCVLGLLLISSPESWWTKENGY